MKLSLPRIFRALLAVSLVLYGPFAMAGERAGGTAFASEICADGVAKVVYLDASGAPAEPHGGCLECQVCCHISIASAGAPDLSTRVLVLIGVSGAPGILEFPDIRRQVSRAMVRGPPGPHALTLISDQQGGCGQALIKDTAT